MTSNNHQNNLSDDAPSKGGKNSPGNFKNDPKRAAEAGHNSHRNADSKSKR